MVYQGEHLMRMTEQAFKARTKEFAHRSVRVAEALPDTRLGRIIAGQLIRSATSVAANYRAACRARSPNDFRNKLSICEEECDEAAFWIEFAKDHGLVSEEQVKGLLAECNEIVAMIVASRKTSLEGSERK